ncbi:phosphate ABC transporter permease subunit PstC [Pseudonocardiaceae bacterium YIM PH 21723]|nr:phosphate ABC transporter permease subunit PstC [Pseudonocardiaceae bacterium YIM PH 21723]
MSDSQLTDRFPRPEGAGGRPAHARHPQEDPISPAAHHRPAPPTGQSGATVRRPGDQIFRGIAVGSGVFIVALIAAVALFLVLQAIPSLAANKSSFLFSGGWSAQDPKNLNFGILDLLWVTVASSLFALVLAMPVALGIALFLTHYAPKRFSRPFAYIVDLLAAVPSIVFGLWGIRVLAPQIKGVAEWLNTNLGWFPLFSTGNVSVTGGGTVFTAGIVLAIMILPIITAVSREVFDRTPTTQIEGALALGATKWEVIRTTVLPFGKAGYVSASMLGLGRALGETIALMLILSATAAGPKYSLFDGGATLASRIGSGSGEFSGPLTTGAYIAAGLVLFILTFVINALARYVVAGKKEYA